MPDLFPLGRIEVRPAVTKSLSPGLIDVFLARHAKGDWGILDAPQRAQNARSLRSQERIFSLYEGPDRRQYLVITEANRQLTTLMPAESY